ncbi:alanine racemase [Bacillus benzoevorans]|uniref:Alanine racemase n=1 Tax=Bacillus benzoevorans TaxID=1456 RepID=A0A7X0HXZ2_9BACI|nr:alanine racemase [Bacillus benzoevorans]MBB6447666.1 alanine racemase [Bacillus benzoevorans]
MDQPFYRDTWAEINLDHISYNVQSLKQRLPENVTLFAVVKANGYGHGDVQTAQSAIRAGASYLAVALIDEAILLRKKGISTPILVLGVSRPEDITAAAQYDITLTVFQPDWLQYVKEQVTLTDPVRVHIKVDTGMGRLGVRTKRELQEVEQMIQENPMLIFEGIFTHFATADEIDQTYYQQQSAIFKEMLDSLQQKPPLIHCSNSASSLRFPENHFNGVRLGISMYGLSPSPEIEPELPYPLKEAFSLITKIVHVKQLHSGDKVSYGATYEAQGDEWIATLPIGYADGWIRKLSGQEVLIDGKRMPIIGRICMDQTMVKLDKFYPAGTVVTLIGGQGKEFISVNEIAQKLDTINYEVTCMITGRVPRVYIQDGTVSETVNGLSMP